MGKLYGLFYGITSHTQAGSAHYRIYVVYTGWNSFDVIYAQPSYKCTYTISYNNIRVVHDHKHLSLSVMQIKNVIVWKPTWRDLALLIAATAGVGCIV